MPPKPKQPKSPSKKKKPPKEAKPSPKGKTHKHKHKHKDKTADTVPPSPSKPEQISTPAPELSTTTTTDPTKPLETKTDEPQPNPDKTNENSSTTKTEPLSEEELIKKELKTAELKKKWAEQEHQGKSISPQLPTPNADDSLSENTKENNTNKKEQATKAAKDAGLPLTSKLATTEENNAAAKMQANHRGKQVRKEIEQKKAETKVKKEEATKAAQDAGLPLDATAATAEENNAAAKMQASHRGKQVRKEITKKKEEKDQHAAATKMQASHRGKQVRKKIEQKKAETKLKKEEATKAAQDAGLPLNATAATTEENNAAAKLQASHRGKQVRKEMEQNKIKKEQDTQAATDAGTLVLLNATVATEEEHTAATKVQATMRGKQARKDAERMKTEDITPLELKEIKQIEKEIKQQEKLIVKEEGRIQAIKDHEEKRVDENDGRQYTKAEFLSRYNSLIDWNRSFTQDQILGIDKKEGAENKVPVIVQDRRSAMKKKQVKVSLEERSELLQLATGIKLKRINFVPPKTLQDAQKMIDRYRERELDLLENQSKSVFLWCGNIFYFLTHPIIIFIFIYSIAS